MAPPIIYLGTVSFTFARFTLGKKISRYSTDKKFHRPKAGLDTEEKENILPRVELRFFGHPAPPLVKQFSKI
jgi:hypothetical protein